MLIKNFNIKLIILISIFFFQTLLSTKGDDLRIEIDNPKFSEKGLNDNVYEIKAKKGFKSEN